MTTTWLKAALIRAIKTIAQTAAATIGVSATMHEVDWLMVTSASILAGILSMLTSVAGIPEVDITEPDWDPDEDLRYMPELTGADAEGVNDTENAADTMDTEDPDDDAEDDDPDDLDGEDIDDGPNDLDPDDTEDSEVAR